MRVLHQSCCTRVILPQFRGFFVIVSVAVVVRTHLDRAPSWGGLAETGDEQSHLGKQPIHDRARSSRELGSDFVGANRTRVDAKRCASRRERSKPHGNSSSRISGVFTDCTILVLRAPTTDVLGGSRLRFLGQRASRASVSDLATGLSRIAFARRTALERGSRDGRERTRKLTLDASRSLGSSEAMHETLGIEGFHRRSAQPRVVRWDASRGCAAKPAGSVRTSQKPRCQVAQTERQKTRSYPEKAPPGSSAGGSIASVVRDGVNFGTTIRSLRESGTSHPFHAVLQRSDARTLGPAKGTDFETKDARAHAQPVRVLGIR